jgi:hypothetical protein
MPSLKQIAVIAIVSVVSVWAVNFARAKFAA